MKRAFDSTKSRLAVLAALLFTALPSTTWAQPAKQLLADAKIRGGLIVCIGCDDPAFLTDFGATYRVHGLDTDPAKVAKARAAIRKLGKYGDFRSTDSTARACRTSITL